ncbi:DUF108 domain-containing protein (plasmid) [Agrobacterium tumefaciens]|uniref:aspartate dehydrogenase domain-containing protein n=1 Tax=Agrobacterium tumefaciens TaxID=358 RepID=UPI0021D03E74|nr:aspartate dehydrogenase domain-containing protein [Agrobacterium tumefaciens]NTZ64186.1 DUF108 domain-containing protein [Agrobacterium tumefaciens]UXT00171.1 DUF108 domain-containing protein [Agrobacterium tumefaciens]UXT52871.1 DUF108 domain-containing protein [Agrobacterium tumefaciens]UXT68931.1 DUF108 domain-containing protein [Agrobacterium tumefaciens]
MKKIGLIGAGRIARELLASMNTDDRDEWQVVIALAREPGQRDGFDCPITNDIEVLLAQHLDLVIETGGPAALVQHGEAVIAVSDLWSVSAAALADEAFRKRLEDAGRRSGHRLRLVSGAIGGLDGLAAMAVHPESRIHFTAGVAGNSPPPDWLFSGTVREAALRFHGINVLAAAALASSGLDAATVDYASLPQGASRRFELEASGPLGRLRIIAEPAPVPVRGTPLVAASILAALRKEGATIQVG